MSEKYSLYGWDWKIWLSKNWDSIVAVLGAISSMVIDSRPALALIVGSALKLIISVGRYYINEQVTDNDL